MPAENKKVFNFAFDQIKNQWVEQNQTTKVLTGDLQIPTGVAQGTVSVSSWFDTTHYDDILVSILHAPVNTAAPAGVAEYYIQVSHGTAATSSDYQNLYSFNTSGATVSLFGVLDNHAAGDRLLNMNPTPAYSMQDILLIYNPLAPEKSEWVRLAALSTNSYIYTLDGLQNTQYSAWTFNEAKEFVQPIDCRGINRVRTVCHNNVGTVGLVLWSTKITAGYKP